MSIRIIQLGKDKDIWLKEALQEYQKRLRPFCKLEILQLPDVSLKDTGNPELVKDKEGKAVLAKLEPGDHVVLLDEKGKQKSSLEFSRFLTNISDIKRIVFIIGGVFGSSAELKAQANDCLSLSCMTFTHRMTRLILVEQIYRAMMINSGRRYHIE